MLSVGKPSFQSQDPSSVCGILPSADNVNFERMGSQTASASAAAESSSITATSALSSSSCTSPTSSLGELSASESSATSSSSSSGPPSAVKPELTNTEKIVTSLAAGAMAGGLAKTVIAPLDRSKIFFQTNEVRNYRFKHAIRWLRHGYRTEGLFSLWRGNSATMARIIPYAAIQFMSHEQYKRLLNVEEEGSPKLLRFAAGSMAGVTGQLITYPLDRARAIMAVTKAAEYRSLPTVFRTLQKVEGGLPSLYRGLTPTMLGVIPYAGVSFFTYETLKIAAIQKYGGGDWSPQPHQRLAAGALAGLLGQAASYPLDIVRRRMQTGIQLGKGNKYSTVIGTIVHVYRTEGIQRGLYKGLSMNFFKGPISSGITFTTFDYTMEGLRKGAINVRSYRENLMDKLSQVANFTGLEMEYHRTFSETAHAAHGTLAHDKDPRMTI